MDTLIGIYIFSILLLSGLSLIKYSSTLYTIQNDLSVAITVMNFVSEDLKAAKYDGISMATDYSQAYTSGALRPSELDKLKNAVVTVTVTQPEAYLKKVLIRLQWSSAIGTSRPLLVTLYFTSKQITAFI